MINIPENPSECNSFINILSVYSMQMGFIMTAYSSHFTADWLIKIFHLAQNVYMNESNNRVFFSIRVLLNQRKFWLLLFVQWKVLGYGFGECLLDANIWSSVYAPRNKFNKLFIQLVLTPFLFLSASPSAFLPLSPTWPLFLFLYLYLDFYPILSPNLLFYPIYLSLYSTSSRLIRPILILLFNPSARPLLFA